MAQPNESLPAAPAIGAMLQDLGIRIRALRRERNLTLERLSELSDLSVGIVSQIERGKGNPSFATLAQLAHGLDIPVGRLLHVSEQNKSPVVRRGERRRLDGHGLGRRRRRALRTPHPRLHRRARGRVGGDPARLRHERDSLPAQR